MDALDLERSRSLQKLYFVRTVFQILWAGGVIATSAAQPTLAAVLVVVYPLWDVACTVFDLRTSALDGGTRKSQTTNAILGIAAAIGIASTAFTHPAYAIGIFGSWAFVAGLLQLIAGIIRRRRLGGQWPMILSGLQSMAAVTFRAVSGFSDGLSPTTNKAVLDPVVDCGSIAEDSSAVEPPRVVSIPSGARKEVE